MYSKRVGCVLPDLTDNTSELNVDIDLKRAKTQIMFVTSGSNTANPVCVQKKTYQNMFRSMLSDKQVI